jgi:hypothetical protein
MARVFRRQLSLVLTARVWAPEPDIRDVQQLRIYSAGLCGSFITIHLLETWLMNVDRTHSENVWAIATQSLL